MADWVTISSLATAGGTLVLAAATFASVRSANRAARVAERSLLLGIRPVLAPSRLGEDPVEEVTFGSGRAFRVPAGTVLIDDDGDAIYLAMPVRNVGAGIAVIHGWYLHVEWDPQAPRPDPLLSERLAKNDIVLLCSDGFWGPLTQRQLLHALMARDLSVAIPELVELAEQRAGRECDNVSVLAMAWEEEQVSTTVAPEPEHTQVQDFTATDLDYMRVSDEDIEKAIADLKAALRKSSAP